MRGKRVTRGAHRQLGRPRGPGIQADGIRRSAGRRIETTRSRDANAEPVERALPTAVDHLYGDPQLTLVPAGRVNGHVSLSSDGGSEVLVAFGDTGRVRRRGDG